MAKIEYVRKVTFEKGDKVHLYNAQWNRNAEVLSDTVTRAGNVMVRFTDGSRLLVASSDLNLIESWDGRVPDDIDPHKQAIDQAYANGYRKLERN